MKTSPVMRLLKGVFLAGAFILSVVVSQAQTTVYTLTTKAGDGGFDGWQGGFQTGPAAGNNTGTQLRVGNAGSGDFQFARAAAVLMFDLSQLSSIDFTQVQITSVTLSFRVTTISGDGPISLALTHGMKTTQTVDYGSTQDTPLDSPTNARWSYIADLDPVSVSAANTTVTFTVTSTFLADLAADNAYSSYRLVQPESYVGQTNGGKLGLTWGLIIASAESGNAIVPTLTITTQAIPEPAAVGLLTGCGVLGVVLFLRRRVRR